MESVIRDAMMEHLNRLRLLRNSQHRLRSESSCRTNLIKFLYLVMDYLDKKGGVDMIFLDFAKAFDKVSHMLLLKKHSSHAWYRGSTAGSKLGLRADYNGYVRQVQNQHGRESQAVYLKVQY
jgi:hypothetical protein